jgi:hypothetical protein
MKKNCLTLTFGIVIGLSGCYYDKEEELYPGSCNTPGTVTYSEHIQPLIAAKCAVGGCHVQGGGGPGLMAEYGALKQFVDNGKFANRVLTEKNMPPGGLPVCELELVKRWVDDGAKND